MVGATSPGARFVSLCKVEIFLFVAFHHDSIDGVADPRMIGQFAIHALRIATSLPLYLGALSCLNEWSCSSSTIMILIWSFCSGAKTALRAPRMMSAVPSATSDH